MPRATHKALRSHKSLWAAWRHVRKNAFESSSPNTQSEAREFELEADSRIRSLSAKLACGSFQFSRSTGVPIKKHNKKSVRPLVKSEIATRIVTRAMLDQFRNDPRFSPILQSPFSFGALPNRRVSDAWEQILNVYNGGYKWYVRSDIEKFFDSIPKEVVRKKFADLIEDPELFVLLGQSLEVVLDNEKQLGKLKTYFPLEELGVAQGSAISPLIANAILDEFDFSMNGNDAVAFRYVDDFIIMGKSHQAVSRSLKRGLRVLDGIGLKAYKPSDNGGKASSGMVQNGLEFLGVKFVPGLLSPAKPSKDNLKKRINAIVKESVVAMNEADSEVLRGSAFIPSLYKISNILKGWGNYYSFCNNEQTFMQIDAWVDTVIESYSRQYKIAIARQKQDKGLWRRRYFGVFTLADSKREPLIAKPAHKSR